MTLWTDLFHTRHLIDRKFYGVPGVQTLTAPDGATILRASAVGAGSWKSGGWGHGSAFARVLIPVSPGEEISLQIGDIAHTLDADNALGDTIITRISDNVVLLKAQAGQQAGPGLAANCIGDVVRDGGAYQGGYVAGSAAGDDDDTHPLGFGGVGSGARRVDSPPINTQTTALIGPYWVEAMPSAVPGGGGGKDVLVFPGLNTIWTQVPGNGRAAIEWFDQDPGY